MQLNSKKKKTTTTPNNPIKKWAEFSAIWMDLQIIILSEVSQTEKDKFSMISLICGI